MKSEPTKKTYNRPELVTYGALAEITRAVGNTGSMDGGTGQMNQTRV